MAADGDDAGRCLNPELFPMQDVIPRMSEGPVVLVECTVMTRGSRSRWGQRMPRLARRIVDMDDIERVGRGQARDPSVVTVGRVCVSCRGVPPAQYACGLARFLLPFCPVTEVTP